MLSTIRSGMYRAALLVSLLITLATNVAPAFASEPLFQASPMAGMDLSVDPGVDFYRFANGDWLTQATIPEDFPSWDTMSMLSGQTRLQLLQLLESQAQNPSLIPGSDPWKAVRLYQQGVDLQARNDAGLTPITETLDVIAAISSSDELQVFLRTSVFHNVAGFFFVTAGPDVRGSGQTIAYLNGPTLGLPDRSYYLVHDALSQPVQQAYIATAAQLLVHSGWETNDPRQAAEQVFAFESKLAVATWSQEEGRDFATVMVEATLPDLASRYPEMDWHGYFAALGLETDRVTVTQERYLENLAQIVDSTSLEVIKDYLALQLIWSSSSSLDETTEAVAFSYFGGALNGLTVQAPIEGRILDQVNALFADALGQLYVSAHFSPEARVEGEHLTQAVIDAFRNRLRENTWMTPATRSAALAKLDSLHAKVGYPDAWITYPDAAIGDSYYASALSAFNANYRRSLATVGHPIDRDAWPFPPQTVNAMYNPANNEIVIPAAVLQTPLFDPEGDVAANLGAIGFVIGHEITHGFDIQGSQFNGEGVLSNWWAGEDTARYVELNTRVAEQYDALSVDGARLDGNRTLAENVADLGGIQVAFDALQAELATDSVSSGPISSDFTPEQRFFIAAATVWRSAIRDEALAAQLAADSHAPAAIRAVQPLRNCDAFHEAFEIVPGEPMYLRPEERIVIW